MQPITAALLRWYRRFRRELPFRESPDPYRVWVSELMLQQTRVETAVPYFRRFVERFPDVGSLAEATEQEVLALWSGLGYYRRAKALHRAARIVVQERGGRFPEDLEGWLALPGVGRYTAGAVLSIAFGKRVAILDGNVARVLSRLYGVSGDPRSGETSRRLWGLAEDLLPRRSVGDFNQALMELGALVCTPRAPRCLLCPLASHCAARREGRTEELPELSARAPAVRVVMGAAVISRTRGVLLYRRTRSELMKDLWELPAGECRVGEDARAALVREARETYGIHVEPREEIVRVRHTIMNRRILLHAFSCDLLERAETGREADRRWVRPEQIGSFPVSSLVLKVLRRLPA